MIPSNRSHRTNQQWDERPTRLRCPCCKRAKPALLRPGKDGNLIGALHWHHDHIMDYPNDLLQDNPQLGPDWMPRLEGNSPEPTISARVSVDLWSDSRVKSSVRTAIPAEGAAKHQIEADRYFSVRST